MRLVNSISIILLLLFCNACHTKIIENNSKLSWDDIWDHNFDESYYINVKDVRDKHTSIVFLITRGKKYNSGDPLASLERYVKSEDFDPIVAYLYILFELSKDKIENDKLLPLLLRFYNVEKHNAVPAYFLSYYYASKSDYQNFLKYLKAGNKRKSFDKYHRPIREILFEYYYKKTGNLIFSYSVSNIFIFNEDVIFGRLASIVKSENNFYKNNFNFSEDVRVPYEQIYKMGLQMERDGDSLIDKLTALGIQRRGLAEKENSKLISEISDRGREYRSLAKFGKGYGESEFLKYLKDYFETGEYQALMKAKRKRIKEKN